MHLCTFHIVQPPGASAVQCASTLHLHLFSFAFSPQFPHPVQCSASTLRSTSFHPLSRFFPLGALFARGLFVPPAQMQIMLVSTFLLPVVATITWSSIPKKSTSAYFVFKTFSLFDNIYVPQKVHGNVWLQNDMYFIKLHVHIYREIFSYKKAERGIYFISSVEKTIFRIMVRMSRNTQRSACGGASGRIQWKCGSRCWYQDQWSAALFRALDLSTISTPYFSSLQFLFVAYVICNANIWMYIFTTLLQELFW